MMFYKFRNIASCVATAVLLTGVGAIHVEVRANEVRFQGWNDEQRLSWYGGTQGSRLMPQVWFNALEQPGNKQLFSNAEYLAGFGYLPRPNRFPGSYPIGFTLDKQPDLKLGVSRLRWYQGQKGATETEAEPWIGLTCSACHTGKILYRGNQQIIDGGSTLSDFQIFVEKLDEALQATWSDSGRWERFAKRVLSKKDTKVNRSLLRSSFKKLLDWQLETKRLNHTDLRYGRGRTDAFGHIFNKIRMFAADSTLDPMPSNAPVSYPFIWHIDHHEKIQWNGIAANGPRPALLGGIDFGALGRNAGEVIGVFGDVVMRKQGSVGLALRGYHSSIRANQLIRLENLVAQLEPPGWPNFLPPIVPEQAAIGKKLFEDKKCGTCHMQSEPGEPPAKERMIRFDEMRENGNLTDIWMACNVFLATSKTGVLAGTPLEFKWPTDKVVKKEDALTTMAQIAIKGALFAKKGQIVAELPSAFLGVEKLPEQPFGAPDVTPSKEEICRSSSHELLAYKARPLAGIWATAPYLHNGSVPTLYDLLLPPGKRPKQFIVGDVEFDPVKVGLSQLQPSAGRVSKFRANNSEGEPIAGNSNEGHDYGASMLTDEERWALIEYLKTLK